MVLINFKQQCNIPTFSRARKGWAKRITGLNKEHSNGYSFQGDFVSLGNFDTNLVNGIYLDCSKSVDENDEVIKTYHIFTCEDGEINLLKTVEDGKGWAVQCWDVIDDYLNKDGITALMQAAWMNENPEVVKILLDASADPNIKDRRGTTALEKTSDKTVFKDLIQELQHQVYDADADGRVVFFYNEYHQKGIMKQMCYQEYCEYTYKHFMKDIEEKTIYETLRKKGDANLNIQKHHNDNLFKKDLECIFNGFWMFRKTQRESLDLEKVWNGEIPIIYRKIDGELLMNRAFIGKQASFNIRNCARMCFYFDREVRTNNTNHKHTFMVRYNHEENIVEVEHFYHYRDDRWD